MDEQVADGAAELNRLGEQCEERGSQEDFWQAFELYKQAARGGHARGAANLAKMYFEGFPVDQNFATARHWASHAADAGDALGLFLLAQMTGSSERGPGDDAE